MGISVRKDSSLFKFPSTQFLKLMKRGGTQKEMLQSKSKNRKFSKNNHIYKYSLQISKQTEQIALCHSMSFFLFIFVTQYILSERRKFAENLERIFKELEISSLQCLVQISIFAQIDSVTCNRDTKSL